LNALPIFQLEHWYNRHSILTYIVILFILCCHNSHLRDLISRTVLLGESNSVLVVGPRGCGKSMV